MTQRFDPPLTDEEKRELYRRGRYEFATPPVPTTFWREEDWIRYIDRDPADHLGFGGRWLPDCIVVPTETPLGDQIDGGAEVSE